MKRGLIIGLIVLVGGALLILPLIKPGAEPEKDPALFAFNENLATKYGQKVTLEIEVKSENIESLSVSFNGKEFKTWDHPTKNVSFEINPGENGIGAKTLTLKGELESGDIFRDSRIVRVLSDVKPEKLRADIADMFTHKPESFTQGLEFYNGKLFEGTGDPGRQGNTLIAEVDLETGKHARKMGLGTPYFGEGITILNDELYQLTWMNGKCFVYDVNDFSKVTREYTYTGEGWGLCNDGKSLIMSDGSERITFRDPKDFSIQRTIEVYNDRQPIGFLNELEFINGFIYANIWQSTDVVVIDPATGKVMQTIDAKDIWNLGKGEDFRNGVDERVLNGIAYDDQTGKLYMTGKNWPSLFEVILTKE